MTSFVSTESGFGYGSINCTNNKWSTHKKLCEVDISIFQLSHRPNFAEIPKWIKDRTEERFLGSRSYM